MPVKTRKAMELSMNTIIVAAIALIVLVVLVIIFTGHTGKFTRGLNDCGSRGGQMEECTSTNTDCVEKGGVPSGACVFYDQNGKVLSGSHKNKVCCVIK